MGGGGFSRVRSGGRARALRHRGACGDRSGRGGKVLGIWSSVLRFITRPRCATGNGSGDAKEAQLPGRCKKAGGVSRFGLRSKRRLSTAGKRNGADAAKMLSRWSILVRVFVLFCGPLVYRRAFFRRSFGTVFGRAKTHTREEPCKTCSTRGRCPARPAKRRNSDW